MKNKIDYYIKELENKYLINFKPKREFYLKIGIGQKRFKMLLNNKVLPTINEINQIGGF